MEGDPVEDEATVGTTLEVLRATQTNLVEGWGVGE